MAYARVNFAVLDYDNLTVVDGASITVRREVAGAPLVALYSDVDGTPLGNPFTAADGGDAGFHAAGGTPLKITATKDGFSRTWRYVQCGNSAWYDLDALLAGKRIQVRAATTANITIATALNNGDSLDGLTLATSDLVLVKNQTAPAENGIYVVGVSPARHTDFDTYNDHVGAMIAVTSGTANASTLYFCSANTGGVLGTDAINFTKANIGPTVDIDGTLAANSDSLIASQKATKTYVDGRTREKLSANRTYYVRTDGSNSNTGLTNSSGGAFLTIQKAIDVVLGTLDLAGFDVTIQLGNTGTYTTAISVAVPQVGAGNITISGDTGGAAGANAATYVLSVTGTVLTAVGNTSRIRIQGVTIAGTTGGIISQDGAYVKISGLTRFGAGGGAHMRANNGTIAADGVSIYVDGGAALFVQSDPHGYVNLFGSTIVVPAAVSAAFTTSFVLAGRLGEINANSVTFTVSGTVTGTRYTVTGNSVINTAGGGASYFPGSVAGSTATGGQYL